MLKKVKVSRKEKQKPDGLGVGNIICVLYTYKKVDTFTMTFTMDPGAPS